MINIFFFDINEVLIDRYPSKIAKELELSEEKINYIFIYSERYASKNPPKNIPKNSNVYYLPLLKRSDLDKITRLYKPDIYLSIGLRIPDIYLIDYFNRLGSDTYMVQHGIFVEHLNRIPLYKLIPSKFYKFLKFLFYISSLSTNLNSSFIKTLKEIYKIYFKGSLKISNSKILNGSKILTKKAFVFDKSWDKYYVESYGYSENQFVYIGNPDYEILKTCLNKKIEKSICYICQSLVEDGRYEKEKYIDFLKNLKANLKNFKVYLKIHPRSDMNLYQPFIDDNFIITNDFMNTEFYIGHYSSLLEISKIMDRNVIIWKLKNHNIPESYLKYGDLITDNWEKVKSYINNSEKLVFNPTKAALEYVKDQRNPYQKIKDQLLSNF